MQAMTSKISLLLGVLFFFQSSGFALTLTDEQERRFEQLKQVRLQAKTDYDALTQRLEKVLGPSRFKRGIVTASEIAVVLGTGTMYAQGWGPFRGQSVPAQELAARNAKEFERVGLNGAAKSLPKDLVTETALSPKMAAKIQAARAAERQCLRGVGKRLVCGMIGVSVFWGGLIWIAGDNASKPSALPGRLSRNWKLFLDADDEQLAVIASEEEAYFLCLALSKGLKKALALEDAQLAEYQRSVWAPLGAMQEEVKRILRKEFAR